MHLALIGIAPVCATERKLRRYAISIAGVAQLVERNLAKVDVAGSNPVSRLKFSLPLALRLNFIPSYARYKKCCLWRLG